MVEGELMATPIEQLNNAIIRLDFVSRSATAVPNVDVRNAIAAMSAHWLKWFEGTYRKTYVQLGNPGEQWATICDRYLQWYARGYMLVPEAVRAQVPQPTTINVSRAALALAEMERVSDAYQAVVNSGIAPIANVVRDQARSLGDSIAREAAELAKAAADALKVGASAVGGFVLLAGLMYVAIKAAKS
jgi:hypothetical protein